MAPLSRRLPMFSWSPATVTGPAFRLFETNDTVSPEKKPRLDDVQEQNEVGNRKNSVITANSGVPILSNVLMRMIFREFSEPERVAFGSSCKRFRAVDFDIDRRTFNEIYISLSKSDQHIYGVRKNFSPTPGYGVVQQSSVEDWWSDHYKYMFKRAKSRKLSIIAKDEETAPHIASMVKTISFEELHISFRGNMDFSDILISVTQNRKLDHANISIIWYRDITSTIAVSLREILLKFPRTNSLTLKNMNCFAMNWINYENLLHLTSCTNSLTLDVVECSVQGISQVFEECCKTASKTVSFEANTVVADSLFSTCHAGVEIDDRPSYRRLVHARY